MSQVIDIPPDSAARIDRVRGEQVGALYREGAIAPVATSIAIVLLVAALAYQGGVPRHAMFGWVAVYLTLAVCHCLLCLGYWRHRPGAADWRLWGRSFALFALAEGLTWGIGSIWLRGFGDFQQELLVMLVMAGAASGTMFSLVSYLPAAFSFLLCCVSPLLFCALAGDAMHAVLAMMVALFLAGFSVAGWRANANLVQVIRLGFENADLAANLRQQKERAEQASVDKSRFLAAASHDLRQPVHALGMFVTALWSLPMEADARRLVGQIDQSVQAMRVLFNALLDISELDAGVVQSHPRPFMIGPLLERVCRDAETEARLKGIELRLLAVTDFVETDPVLLERILRNLIANAVRYTEYGQVLVRCRRAARLRVQVWDSGPGIARDQRELVFQEFHQVGNPERDRTKGLGLGLAIVKRLTALIDCPLSLRSRPGRGSVFTVAVPLANEICGVSASPPDRQETEPGQRLILVVDDDEAVREAMRRLLASWGHTVIAAASGAELVELVADCLARPDLLICDFRLRGGDNGIAVIEGLRSEYNADIPAMLITGDTAPDRLREARESGLMLLHKPVSHRDLRLAIASLTAASGLATSAMAADRTARAVPPAWPPPPLAYD